QGASEGQLAARLAEFGQALAAFAQDLGERMRDVVVLTMSEFGRTVQENGNSGTDHGHATAMLVLGGPVNGGKVLGRWPGLDPAPRRRPPRRAAAGSCAATARRPGRPRPARTPASPPRGAPCRSRTHAPRRAARR